MCAEPESSELSIRPFKPRAGSGDVEGVIDGAIVWLFGCEQSHASPGGVQLPFRETRHCAHHMSLQMHWASPTHVSVELGSHWSQSGIAWLGVTGAGAVALVTEWTGDTGEARPFRNSRPLRTIASASRRQYNTKMEYQNDQRCHGPSFCSSTRIAC